MGGGRVLVEVGLSLPRENLRGSKEGETGTQDGNSLAWAGRL